jgi:hypothetical protein
MKWVYFSLIFLCWNLISACQATHIHLHGSIHKPYCGGARPTEEQAQGITIAASKMVFSVFGSDFLSFGYLARRTREKVIDDAFENRSFNSKSQTHFPVVFSNLICFTFSDSSVTSSPELDGVGNAELNVFDLG